MKEGMTGEGRDEQSAAAGLRGSLSPPVRLATCCSRSLCLCLCWGGCAQGVVAQRPITGLSPLGAGPVAHGDADEAGKRVSCLQG